MTHSTSDFVAIRGLRYHVRRWGRAVEFREAKEPMLFLVHGWMDVSATFAPVAERLAEHFQVLAPDWRGFGLSEWPQDGYWFQDYVADLDALAEHYSPDRPILLAGHSMGSTAAAHFAGLRPERVARLAILDGLSLPNGDPSQIVKIYRRWLHAVRNPVEVPSYRTFEELAERVQKRNPKLAPEHCVMIARAWGVQREDGLVYLAADPKHLLNMPRTYSQAESDLIWSGVTAPTLFVEGGASPFFKQLPPGEPERRRALFRDRRSVTLEGAGHMLHFDAPAELARELAGFFGG